jgi:hypothetical protein
MIVVKAYLVTQKAEVQIFDTSIFTTRNRVVYSRPIKVYQGIDNPVQVIIRNQDQKSVNLTGYSVTAMIQDPVNAQTMNSYAVSFSTPGADITMGLGSFTIDQGTLNNLENRTYKLTFSTTLLSGPTTTPLYIDDDYGVPLDLFVLPAYFSTTAPAPDLQQESITVDGGSL